MFGFNYDLSMIRDVLFVPNGINSAYLEENYVLTGYINDINTQYTQVLAEYGNSGAYTSVYEYGMQRTSMYQNSQVYSYEYDGRGSVSELVNAVGKTQIKYGYGAYGETVSTVIGWNNPVTNPYRYNAERIDDVAGVPAFQYLRARYLNPYTASFLTQDSYLGQLTSPLSQNRYAYAHNNPVMYTDPSGHFITGLIIAGLVIAGIGATTYVVADAVENDAINDYYKAEEDYEKAGQEVLAAGDRISQIYQEMDAAYFAGDNTNVCKNYLSLVKEYANYGNAYAKTCFSFDEMSAQAERAGIAGRVKRFGFGMFATGLGIAAIGAAPALPSALGVYGTVADVVTMGGMVSGTTSIYFGTSDMTEGITGYNPVMEQLFQGNAAAYAQAENLSVSVSELVILGGIIGYQVEQIQQKTSANFDAVKNNQLSTPSSKVLRKHMIEAGVKEPEYANAAHHIVAGTHPKAAEARAVLQKFGIDINDSANGVFLPTVKDVAEAAYHPSLHTNEYFAQVNKLLSGVTSKQQALNVLNYIGESLQNGTFIK